MTYLIVICCFACLPATRPAEISVSEFGAVADDEQDDTAAIQRAITASPKGATVIFPPGVYRVRQTLVFGGQRNYRGEPNAILQFTLPPETYGIAIEANASDVAIDGFKLMGGGIRLSDGQHYREIQIINNVISQTAQTPGVYCAIPSERLSIEHNRFHDFAQWGVIAYHMERGSVSHNTFHNIVQGAHVLSPGLDCVLSFNTGTKLIRMGLEVQRLGKRITENLVVEGNAFYDWRLPYCDSFGLSVVSDGSINTRIVNNYVRADFSGPWNEQTARDGQGQRFGYGIEAGFRSGVVEGNVIGGAWAHHIVASHPNTPVRNNKLYGKPVWKKHIGTEPGPDGGGSVQAQNNLIEPDMKKMPPPPAIQPKHTSAAHDEGSR